VVDEPFCQQLSIFKKYTAAPLEDVLVNAVSAKVDSVQVVWVPKLAVISQPPVLLGRVSCVHDDHSLVFAALSLAAHVLLSLWVDGEPSVLVQDESV